MRILLVDNDPVYLRLLEEVLTLYAHQVVTAPDGDAALSVLQHETVHMIISDVSMPNVNGMDLHIKVREDQRHRSTPFAWNSAYPELLGVLAIADPSIDFKVEKTAAIPDLLHLVSRIDAARRLQSCAHS